MLCGLASFAQPSNDECQFAQFLPDVSDYCSEPKEYTNVAATADPTFPNGCVALKFANGVWFSFFASEPAVSIRVLSGGQEGTIKNPKILLFDACNSFVECSPGKTADTDEFLFNNLKLNRLYYIMIESSVGGEGSFRLCVDLLNSVKIPESDCASGVVLCDKSPFVVSSLTGAGNNANEIEANNCIEREFQSSWYKWTCDQPGTLTFTLTPGNNSEDNTRFITDDLDFAVYELPNGIDNCAGKKLVRCMAAGANTLANGAVAPLSQWVNCNGLTGLSLSDTDITEPAGCSLAGQNNFVRALDMEAGKSYVLIVNNFSRSGLGFSIEFGGTGTFLGPKVDYEAIAQEKFECDKEITFNNLSTSETDPITSYFWNFGDGAAPGFSDQFGPVDVNYASFGTKTTALTVTTTRGCSVTKLVDFFINPCCKDTSTLAVRGLVTDLPCFGDDSGVIIGSGERGAPSYMYSLDTVNFQPNPRFLDLSAGQYTLYIRDQKGCISSVPLLIQEPPPVIADAGPDIEVELGETATLNGSYIPGTGAGTPLWSPADSIEDVNAFRTDILPLKSKTYTLLVTDENGCTGTDQMEVRVRIVRPVYSPNVIQAGNAGPNGIFKLEGGRAVKLVTRLEIYDRWGNKLYQGTDLDIRNFDEGWKADCNGKKVNPGVYTWLAVVKFLDDVEIAFSGDVTVVE